MHGGRGGEPQSVTVGGFGGLARAPTSTAEDRDVTGQAEASEIEHLGVKPAQMRKPLQRQKGLPLSTLNSKLTKAGPQETNGLNWGKLRKSMRFPG